MNNRYQLIRPIISDKIYESSSMMKSAKKCYQEVKNAKLINAKTFTIKDIDSHKTFTFQIHSTFGQYGGDGEPAPTAEPVPTVEPTIPPEAPTVEQVPIQNNSKNIKDLELNFKKLDMRVGILEQIINPQQPTEASQNVCQQNAYIKNINRLQQNPSNNETCSVM